MILAGALVGLVLFSFFMHGVNLVLKDIERFGTCAILGHIPHRGECLLCRTKLTP